MCCKESPTRTCQIPIITNHLNKIFLSITLLSVLLSSCVSSTNQHVVGKGSSLSSAAKNIAFKIKSKYDIAGRNIQVSPNNFWERDTKINLPFSSVLSDTLSAELSGLGANITVQETGSRPLKLTGSYQAAGSDVMIMVNLRIMGDAASTDLVVVQERIPKDNMDPAWMAPQFGRLARTLVRLLEDDYTGMQSLNIQTDPFVPGGLSQPELALGPEFQKYMKDALAASPVFRMAADASGSASAVLKGDYVKMGNKMVFHAAIVDKARGKNLAGAFFESPIQNIPEDLLQPDVQSLDDLARKLSSDIIKKYSTSPFSKKGQNIVYINKNNIHDTSLRAVVPLSLRLAEKFKTLFSKAPGFTVTDNPSADCSLVLAARIYREGSTLFVSANLDKIVPETTGYQLKTMAFSQEKLNCSNCEPGWFKVDLKARTDFLMHRLEKKSMPHISAGKRSEIVINRLKYQNSKKYSQFSDYLEGYMLDYFAGSRYFSPVKNVEQRLSAVRTRGVRSIVATKKTEATVAALASAAYYIEGSFWPDSSGDVEIKATLSSVQGQILSSEHIKISKQHINPQWIKPPENKSFIHDLNTLSTDDSKLFVQLLTQKGRNNLSFASGEEIVFLVKANKNVYLKLYTTDTDRNIFRIFPNEFTSARPMIKAGQVASIPDNSYTSDFAFKVQGKTGNEMVFAFASDKPLPDLPGSADTGFHGMHQINLDIKGIKQWFSEYALQRGISLSWDALPIRTF